VSSPWQSISEKKATKSIFVSGDVVANLANVNGKQYEIEPLIRPRHKVHWKRELLQPSPLSPSFYGS
jgi:hypothetical protein